ncbi:MAG: hypothetical protein KDK25_10905, partial [Leptospiraceae bacterium]|nr:hypothetical protein [Leptospiraceae bacterium]
MVIFFPLILLFVSSACGPDLPTETEQILPGDGVRLESTWEYRWGDSPRAESGDFLWLKEVGPDANLPSPPQQDRKPDSENDDPGKQGSVGWSHLPFPAQPPGRQGNTFIWQRVQIPEGQWRDPALYIYSVDTIFEAYADGKQIYRYGNLDVERPAFEGWPFHLIALPRNIEGKYLYLRVYSDYPDIGV